MDIVKNGEFCELIPLEMKYCLSVKKHKPCGIVGGFGSLPMTTKDIMFIGSKEKMEEMMNIEIEKD